MKFVLSLLLFFIPILSFAAPSRLDLVVNILKEFQADVDIRDGGICIFKDGAKPFSQNVMLDCESFLNELLLDHHTFVTKPSRFLIDNLLSYGEELLKSLYVGDVLTLSSDKEVDAITFSRLLLYVMELEEKDASSSQFSRVFEFYTRNDSRIAPIFESLKEEETVSKLIIALEVRKPKEILKEESPALETSEVVVDEEVSPAVVVSSSQSEGFNWTYSLLGLVLIPIVVFIALKKKSQVSSISVDVVGMSKEERAELRELKEFFGVTNTASLQDLSKSYRSMVREVHPDSSSADVNVFLKLQEKYTRIRELQERFLKEKLS